MAYNRFNNTNQHSKQFNRGDGGSSSKNTNTYSQPRNTSRRPTTNNQSTFEGNWGAKPNKLQSAPKSLSTSSRSRNGNNFNNNTNTNTNKNSLKTTGYSTNSAYAKAPAQPNNRFSPKSSYKGSNAFNNTNSTNARAVPSNRGRSFNNKNNFASQEEIGSTPNGFKSNGFKSNGLKAGGFKSGGFKSEGFKSTGFKPRSSGNPTSFKASGVKSGGFKSEGFKSNSPKSNNFSANKFSSSTRAPINQEFGINRNSSGNSKGNASGNTKGSIASRGFAKQNTSSRFAQSNFNNNSAGSNGGSLKQPPIRKSMGRPNGRSNINTNTNQQPVGAQSTKFMPKKRSGNNFRGNSSGNSRPRY